MDIWWNLCVHSKASIEDIDCWKDGSERCFHLVHILLSYCADSATGYSLVPPILFAEIRFLVVFYFSKRMSFYFLITSIKRNTGTCNTRQMPISVQDFVFYLNIVNKHTTQLQYQFFFWIWFLNLSFNTIPNQNSSGYYEVGTECARFRKSRIFMSFHWIKCLKTRKFRIYKTLHMTNE